MSKKVLSLVIAGAVLLVIIGLTGSFVVYKKLLAVPTVPRISTPTFNLVPSREKGSPANFTVVGTPKTVRVGQIFTADISIQSEEHILAVDLDINYDTKVLALEKIVPGNLFSDPMEFSKSTDTKEGKIFYALGSLSGSSGKGTIATLTFKAISNTSEPKIYLGERTNASAKGDKELNIILPKN